MSIINVIVLVVVTYLVLMGALYGVSLALNEKKDAIARRQRLKEEAEKKERENLEQAVTSIERLMAGEQ